MSVADEIRRSISSTNLPAKTIAEADASIVRKLGREIETAELIYKSMHPHTMTHGGTFDVAAAAPMTQTWRGLSADCKHTISLALEATPRGRDSISTQIERAAKMIVEAAA